ncbi:hypothetical protein J0A68_16710 [Algoriphagus sp. H41]|uniref:Response regulator n=1 Tax=Algoriphagus oliviformis TaxID=2811231 RepID=A0ABS3C6F7_9BACT|nr:hypothetical protein [Algoriphagus oliviformis]MBN7812598.1 hypothetical protein [Algoriphagus oliviformis]
MSAELILVDDDKVLLRVLEKMLRIVNPSLQLSSFSAGKTALDHLLKRPPFRDEVLPFAGYQPPGHERLGAAQPAGI